MAATPYKSVNFSGEALSQAKFQQLANNGQWLFENTPRVRYSSFGGLLKDSNTKIISGKSPYTAVNADYARVAVYFGSFFTAGCKPNVTATVEVGGGLVRKVVSLTSLSGGGVDHTGFVAELFTVEAGTQNRLVEAGGFIHWQAIGY